MTHRRFAFCLCLLSCIFGCTGTSEPDSASSGSAESKADNSVSRIEFTHPTSADELVATFTAAFNAGDLEAIEQLTYWKDATATQKEWSTNYLAGDAGKYRIKQINIIGKDREKSGLMDAVYSFSTDEVLEVTSGDESTTVIMMVPFGSVDGKFYLSSLHHSSIE